MDMSEYRRTTWCFKDSEPKQLQSVIKIWYLCMMVASASTPSMIANRIPRQSRGPAEKGILKFSNFRPLLVKDLRSIHLFEF